MTTARLTLPALFTIFILAATIGAAAGLSVSDGTPTPIPGFGAPAGPGAPAPMLPEGVERGIDPAAPAAAGAAGAALAM